MEAGEEIALVETERLLGPSGVHRVQERNGVTPAPVPLHPDLFISPTHHHARPELAPT